MQFLGCNKKSGRFESVSQKCKIAENLHWIDCHCRPKIDLNPNFLGYDLKSPWTGANMHMRFCGLNVPLEKVSAFLKSHRVRQKTRNFFELKE